MKKYKIVRTNGIESEDVIGGLTWREAKIYIDHQAFYGMGKTGEVWYLKIVEDEDIDEYEQFIIEYTEEA